MYTLAKPLTPYVSLFEGDTADEAKQDATNYYTDQIIHDAEYGTGIHHIPLILIQWDEDGSAVSKTDWECKVYKEDENGYQNHRTNHRKPNKATGLPKHSQACGLADTERKMKYVTYTIIAFLCVYAIADIAKCVIDTKAGQVGYNPQQIAFMDQLVEDSNAP